MSDLQPDSLIIVAGRDLLSEDPLEDFSTI